MFVMHKHQMCIANDFLDKLQIHEKRRCYLAACYVVFIISKRVSLQNIIKVIDYIREVFLFNELGEYFWITDSCIY